MINQRGIVYTFYSFKGGVGRSMALANVAALLAKAGNRVLIIDWDLEAPGLEKYFENRPSTLSGSRKNIRGIVDLVVEYANNKSDKYEQVVDWRSCLLFAYPFKDGKPISILTAGKDDDNYVLKLQAINWEFLFNDKAFGSYLESLREEWINEYDYVLIDSRTGITDIGGICTIHLPDAIVMLFTANDQSVEGIRDIYKRVAQRFKSLPLDRSKFLAIPVPSRFDNVTEHKLATQWKGIFADKLFDLYKEWLPDKVSPSNVLEKLFIPYIPYWSFGEGLPVVSEGTSDPRSLGFSYNLLALLLANRIQWNLISIGDLTLSNELGADRVNEIANSFFKSLPPFEQEEMKQVMLRLVNPINNTRVVMKETDVTLRARYLIDEFVKGGILFRSRDSLTNEPTLEISHDSILLNWIDLQSWIKESRDFLAWRQDLYFKAKAWEDGSHNNLLLLSGTDLEKASRLLKLRKIDFNQLEMHFINRSTSYERRRNILKNIPLLTVILTAVVFVSIFFQKQQRTEELLQKQINKSDSINSELQINNSRLLQQYRLTLDSLSVLKYKSK